MAQAKTEQFDQVSIQLAEFARALAHPARIAILRTLAERDTCVCGEIVDLLPLAQSTVSQHLQELKKIGVIQGAIEGPKSCYCINWTRLNNYVELVAKFLADLRRDALQSGAS
ncbi:MAG: ArsR/SmtB family transcription factor [bacterium]